MNVPTLNRISSTDRRVVDEAGDAKSLCRAWRGNGSPGLFFPADAGEFGWSVGGLVAHRPDVLWSGSPTSSDEIQSVIDAIDRVIRLRRRVGGSRETGVALLAAYEALGHGGGTSTRTPSFVALAVDRSVRFEENGRAILTSRPTIEHPAARGIDRMLVDLDASRVARPAVAIEPARVIERPRTSLPRARYLKAVETIRRHIARGDIYQANLCQRFEAAYSGDPFEWWAGFSDSAAAPRAVWFETNEFALASMSPEVFFTAESDGTVVTRPIKGTRPRGATPDEDRLAAEELTGSEKDRAELLMIVDLERNDLGRICRVGSVHATSIGDLRTFASVHHLVAKVEGRLRDDLGLGEILASVFPGGSITGAPKIAATRILAELEPVPRGFFTGSLIWAGDDGSLDSSILIRSPIFSGGTVALGAGGGIVTDSDPEDEWRESNHKARAPSLALGFEPEEAMP